MNLNNNPHVEVVYIQTDAIGLTEPADRRYLYTYSAPSEGLIHSIKHAGIMQPLVLARDDTLISGLKRLWAAQALNLREVPVIRTDDPAAAFREGLWENLGHGRFTDLEVADLLDRAQQVLAMPPKECCERLLPALGMPASETLLEKFLTVAALPQAIKDKAAKLGLRKNHLFQLAACPETDADGLVRLFGILSPNTGETRILLDLLQGLARRENRPVAAILEDPDLTALTGQDKPAKQKIQKLRQMLQTRLMPDLAARETEARQLAAQGGLAGAVRLQIPPDLTGGVPQITFSVKQLSDVTDAADLLSAEKTQQAINAILHALRGDRYRP